MAIGHLTPAALRAMREHGHYDCWEVANYADGDSVTVECTKCGEVLVELVNQDMEEEEGSNAYLAARALMETLDAMEQEGTSQSPDANTLRNTLQDLKLTDEEEERLDAYSVELRRKRENVEDDDAWLDKSEKYGTDTDGTLLVPSRGDTVYCQDCGWKGEKTDCNPIQDIYQRVAAGEPMPAGECPKCGALCQLEDAP